MSYNEAMITKTITSTADRKAFYGIAREVVESSTPVAVRNRGRRSVVIIPESEYNSIMETEYLLSGRNGEELRESMRQAERGEGRIYTMEELRAKFGA